MGLKITRSRRRKHLHARAGRRHRASIDPAAGRRAGIARYQSRAPRDRRRAGRPHAAPRRLARAADHHRRPGRGARRRQLRLDPAARRRPAGAPVGRDAAPRVRHHRPGDDRRRAASPRRCERCRWCSIWRSRSRSGRRRTPGSSTSPTRSASSPARCSTRATGAIGLCNVAIGFQRRFAERSASRRSRCELDHVGPEPPARGARRRASTAIDRLPELLDVDGDELGDRSACRREIVRAARARAVLLPALLLLRRQVLAEQLDGHTRAQEVMEIERRAARAVQRPDARHQARAARAPRRRVLQRGRRAADRVATRRARRHPGGRYVQPRRAARTCLTTSSWKCRRASRETAPSRCDGAARARDARAGRGRARPTRS